jgi:hypothetical protein
MKHLLIAASAVAALTAASAPAFAQPYFGHDRPGYGVRDIDDREASIADRIDEGERRGDLNRWEARRLRYELQGIRNLEARYRHNGYNRGGRWLSDGERADLQRRLDHLSGQVFRERRDR